MESGIDLTSQYKIFFFIALVSYSVLYVLFGSLSISFTFPFHLSPIFLPTFYLLQIQLMATS